MGEKKVYKNTITILPIILFCSLNFLHATETATPVSYPQKLVTD